MKIDIAQNASPARAAFISECIVLLQQQHQQCQPANQGEMRQPKRKIVGKWFCFHFIALGSQLLAKRGDWRNWSGLCLFTAVSAVAVAAAVPETLLGI